jgi:T5SS/PEP-CTERM-associated repeat protein
MTVLTVFLYAAPSFANPFDDGTEHMVTNDTDYGYTLYVGSENPDNTLIITNDSTIRAESVIIGEYTDSTNNAMSILSDSLLVVGHSDTNGLATGGIVVGDESGDSMITVNNASKLETEHLYVGFGTNDTGEIALSGTGTELNIAQDAYVGYAGSTNTVNIGEGSAMNVGDMLTVGQGGSNNYINVSGSLYVNSTNNINVVNADSDNGITVKNGGTLQVGGDVETETLAALGIEMQSRSTLELGGELALKDNSLDSGHSVILNNDLSGNQANWTADSSGTYGHIGKSSSYNTLTFTNGATGSSSLGLRIGTEATASYNQLTIGGEGSKLIAEKSVLVGGAGSNNKLNITDGGELQVDEALALGKDAQATGNEANVGSNSVLAVGATVFVGANGDNNTFNIDYGRVTVADNFILGGSSSNNRYYQAGGTNTVAGAFIVGATEESTGETGHVDDDAVETTGNLAMVGTNATLNVQQLTVGQNGGGSIVTIRDGGVVNVASDTVIGEAVGDNYIYLQRGSNTQFNVTGDLVVGKEGGSNRFAAYGGTATIGGNLYLGATTNQHDVKNFIHLETTNATLNVAGAVHIGASNSVNTLDIVDGARLTAQDLLVGAYEGTSNNVVTISGGDSLLAISDTLTIGSASGTNNSITVKSGGTLDVAQDKIEIGSTNDYLTVADGGTLKTQGWDFNAQTDLATNIVLEAGATLHMLGSLSGTNMVDGELNFVLDGAGSTWDPAGDVLYVGHETGNNSLTITNGASASTLTNLYIGFATSDNTVTVGGSGSSLDIGADLFVGTETNESTFNTLAVLDEANVMVGNDAYLYRGAVLKIDSSSQVTVAGDYEQDGISTLEIGVSSNQVNPNLVVGGNAGFSTSEDEEEYPLMRVFDDGIGESNIVTIVKAGSITVDDELATSGSIKGNIATNLLLGFTVTLTNDVDNTYIVLDDFVKHSIGDAGDLEGQLLDVANEIEAMAEGGDSNASNMVRIIEGMDSSSEVNAAMESHFGEKQSSFAANNVLGLGLQNVAEQLTVRADNTRARMGSASASIDWDKPAGAAGPHQSGQQLQGWLAGYGTWGSQSDADGFDGYDAAIRGFLIGVDLSVADNILVGVAGGSGSSTIDKDNGGSADTRTTYASLYASLGTQSWFADASFIFGGSSVDSDLGPAFDTTADYNARNIAFYLGGGKEIISEYLIITPQASILANHYSQDAYEESASVTARAVDSFDTLYVQSSIGCNLGFYTAVGETTLKPEFRAHWLHEFNGDEESVSYSLIGGDGTQHTLFLQAPEGDLIKLGAGVSAKVSEDLELRFDLDTRQSSNYSDYTVLGSLRYQF